MSAWTPKPTEPGLYLYTGKFDKNLPVEYDGRNLWIRLPEGSRASGQRAIMFRPAGGLFWSIPTPPAIGLIHPIMQEAIKGIWPPLNGGQPDAT